VGIDLGITDRPQTPGPPPVTKPSRRLRWLVPLVATASAGVLVLAVRGTSGRPDATRPSGESALTSARVRAAERSVVKITASGCKGHDKGTGFVYAPQRVMTNAHVVAGSHGPVEVSVPGRRRYPATVVLYDPRRDVAVLAVPGLPAAALELNRSAARGAAAVIPGYSPQAFALAAVAGQIRSKQIVVGPDIYRSLPMVRREIFSVHADLPESDSGAPLLAADGTVYGLVFASALDRDQTAYALTAQEISPAVQTGHTATRTVSTRRCPR
jgi:S1-C subfamily serine protease